MKKKTYKTLELFPQPGEMLKPAELIEIEGANNLNLADKRLFNELLANAFGPAMADEGQEWAIPLSELKGSHTGNERIEASILALMKTIVTVRLENGDTRRVALLGGNDLSANGRARGVLRYSFDPRLVPVLKESSVFGKIELEVMYAFSGKYALGLYESLSKRCRLSNKFYEDFDLKAFRNLIGVPDGTLEKYGNLNARAIQPAVIEVNALAQFECRADALKTGRGVTGVRLSWWMKDIPARKKAWTELQRHKAGRKSRIAGTVELVDESEALEHQDT